MLEKLVFWAVWIIGLLPLLAFFRSRELDRAVPTIMLCAFLVLGALSAGIAGNSSIAIGFLAGWLLIFTGIYIALARTILYFLHRNKK